MKIGSYEVLDELGRGGMGVVHAGRSPDGKPVAIKLLLKTTKRESVARFDRERRLQAALGDAAGFVPVLDVGDAPQGPWIVMPLLPGGTLRAKLHRGPLGVEETLALGRALAASLGRAHALGIVHRDMKPDNVLFTAENEPRISDMGLAKHFTDDAPGASQSVSLSRTGELMGTAGYMAPEQMNDARAVGPPADVFALGAILYECLSGKPAFEADSIHGVFARVALGEFEPLRKLCPRAPRWLVAVIERALAKTIAARFPDGAAFCAALEAPAADPRSNALFAVLGAVIVFVVAAVAWASASSGKHEPKDTGTATVGSGVATPGPRRTSPPWPKRRRPSTRSRSAATGVRSTRSRSRRAATSSPRPATTRWCGSSRRRTGSSSRPAPDTIAWRSRSRLSPRGDLLATGSQDAQVLVWDVHTGAPLRTLMGSETTTQAVAFSADYVASGSSDGSVRLYKAVGSGMSADFEVLPAVAGRLNSIAFSPGGSLLATAASDGLVRLWSMRDRSVSHTLAGHAGEAVSVAFSPRGDLVSSAGRDGTIRVWTTREGQSVTKLEGHERDVLSTAFSPSGNVIVSGGADKTVRFWNLRTGLVLATLTDHTAAVNSVATSPRFDFVASAGDDQVIRIRDVPREARDLGR